MPGLEAQVKALLSAVQPWPDGAPAEGADGGWVKFTRKWGLYGAEQREAIRVQLYQIL